VTRFLGPELESRRGVYLIGEGTAPALVHLYEGGDYSLADVPQYFQLGRLETPGTEGETVVFLEPAELRQLEVMAYAYSFDYEEDFIGMCLGMRRAALARGSGSARFAANF